MRFQPTPIDRSFSTNTAPTGTSPSRPARRASSHARNIQREWSDGSPGTPVPEFGVFGTIYALLPREKEWYAQEESNL